MCGIVGYIGNKDIETVLVVGLERLSYRGYDSAGISTISDSELFCWKTEGKIHDLENILRPLSIRGNIGIGHTRWATHGKPNTINAHPQLDSSNKIALVHNGIIENYSEIKKELLEQNVIIRSETDSELIVHLISLEMEKGSSLEDSVIKSTQKLKGSYALAVICEQEPNKIIAIKKDSPLIVGIGKNEYFISSDVNAIVQHTKEIIYLENNDVAILEKDKLSLKNTFQETIQRPVECISYSIDQSEKGSFEYFMHKEIHEQTDIIKKICNNYIKNDEIQFGDSNLYDAINLEKANRFVIQACGTSWHAGLIGKYFIESYARIPTEVDFSSEMRYRQIINGFNDVVIAISQSGETADTLACLRTAKINGFPILSFVNVKGSSIDRESNAVIHTLSGPEIGVASTKNYLSQLLCIYLFSLSLGRKRGLLDKKTFDKKLSSLASLPAKIDQIIAQEKNIQNLAKKYAHCSKFLFVGRHLNYPTALEAALKLKEISYIHATGYPAGELKHGPIALIDKDLPVLCIAPKNTSSYSKMATCIEEISARNGDLILLSSKDNKDFDHLNVTKLDIPDVDDEDLSPLLSIVPLQLLSYFIAVERECNVDQPRNLAKSVTVE